MKSTDEVFSPREINPGFAADRRIDLRQKRCRDLNERQSAQVNRSGETREVADDATAECEYEIVPFKAVFAQESYRFFKATERLIPLALRHEPFERRESGSLQRTLNFTAVE